LRAVSAHRASGLSPIRGSIRKSLICRISLTQVVDFHEFSTYFQWCLWRPFTARPQSLKDQNRPIQVVDFHDSFRYFCMALVTDVAGPPPASYLLRKYAEERASRNRHQGEMRSLAAWSLFHTCQTPRNWTKVRGVQSVPRELAIELCVRRFESAEPQDTQKL
jgi:hypothetical protein